MSASNFHSDQKKIHYLSGIIITIFILLHLFNHVCSIAGIEQHIAVMHTLRLFYRNVLIETILLFAVLVQIITGIKLFINARKRAAYVFEKIHIWSGLYLALFFVIHISAVLAGRFLLHLDTNFYFGAAGINTFPFNLFFIPYYALAIISFFAHIASIHAKKMKASVIGLTPAKQALVIILLGCIATITVFYGLTNHFKGVAIPDTYNILIGK